jgi:hypothetical protein
VIAHAGAADESLSVAMVLAAAWLAWIGRQRLKGAGFDRLPRGGAYALFGVAVVLVVGAAWLPRAIFPRTPPAAPAGVVRIPSTATLTFEEPRDGAVVGGDQLEVVMDLEGGTVVPATSTTLAPDEGHLHLRVDGQLVSMTFGSVQVIDMRPYGPGRHTIEAEFVAADHLPFDPPVEASVEVLEG